MYKTKWTTANFDFVNKFTQDKTHTCSNSSESLLASCIPDLQLNAFAIKFNGSYLEINTAIDFYNKIIFSLKKYTDMSGCVLCTIIYVYIMKEIQYQKLESNDIKHEI